MYFIYILKNFQYRVYNQGGNRTLYIDQVACFSTTTMPFPASESAVIRWSLTSVSLHAHIYNSDRYVNDTLNPFFNQLTAEERQNGYFQQDNATAHTANATRSQYGKCLKAE
jgi:hypothetical protein